MASILNCGVGLIPAVTPFGMVSWLLPALLGGIALAAAGVRRRRFRQRHDLQRLRERIATDLHDDIGSSLTQIAVLSEIVRQSMNGDPIQAARLSRIADLSRELADSMSDIVWSINPQRDHLSDLTFRMRRFASDVLTARDIRLDFQAPDGGDQIPVRAEVRRQTFLIFKECVHNVVKHAACDRVEVVLRTEQRRLVMQMTDNGKGFDAGRKGHGQGLVSMQRRAMEMGGRLQISSAPGRGAALALSVPLGLGRPRARRKSAT